MSFGEHRFRDGNTNAQQSCSPPVVWPLEVSWFVIMTGQKCWRGCQDPGRIFMTFAHKNNGLSAFYIEFPFTIFEMTCWYFALQFWVLEQMYRERVFYSRDKILIFLLKSGRIKISTKHSKLSIGNQNLLRPFVRYLPIRNSNDDCVHTFQSPKRHYHEKKFFGDTSVRKDRWTEMGIAFYPAYQSHHIFLKCINIFLFLSLFTVAVRKHEHLSGCETEARSAVCR